MIDPSELDKPAEQTLANAQKVIVIVAEMFQNGWEEGNRMGGCQPPLEAGLCYFAESPLPAPIHNRKNGGEG